MKGLGMGEGRSAGSREASEMGPGGERVASRMPAARLTHPYCRGLPHLITISKMLQGTSSFM